MRSARVRLLTFVNVATEFDYCSDYVGLSIYFWGYSKCAREFVVQNQFIYAQRMHFFCEWKVCELECVCTVDYKHLPEIANCLIRLIRSPAEVICKCIALKLTQIIQKLQNQRARKHNVTFFPFLFFLLCLSFCFSLEYQSLVLYQFFIVLFLYLFCPIRAYIYCFFLSESALWLNPMQLAQRATV